MIDLCGSRFTDIMPENLASQLETQAFAYAVGRQVEKLCINADRVRIYAAVDDMPEHILDVLAVELRTPAYNQDFSIEVKRELVKETIPFYTKLGTPAAVNKMIHAVFGGGDMEEWFTYGGDPHYFRAVVNITEMEIKPGAIREFIRIISSVKRLSSWLDEIRFYLTPAKSWATAGGAFTGSMEKDTATVFPPPLEPPGGRFTTIAGGGLTGSWSKNTAAIQTPELIKPGGRVAVIAGGAFTGSRRKDTATVTHPPLTKPEGRAATMVRAGYIGACQLTTAHINTRGAGEVPAGKAATGGAAGVFHTYQRITREVKIYGTLERRRSNQ